MLDSQWFVICLGQDESVVKTDSLPAGRLRKIFRSAAGAIAVVCGASVLQEEDEETYALAVGDTRSLRGLKGFDKSGPNRHAAICVIDKRSQEIRVVTDRVNFSKIFCYKAEPGRFVLSTHLSFFDRPRLPLSATGLACGIANGTQFNNSTVFKDISVLERASTHEFSGDNRTTKGYWEYRFDAATEKGVAKQRLKDCLVEAVRDQVCDRPLLLSLSGGFDSSGILGILAKFVRPNSLNTFSYSFGEPRAGSDALVARQMAALTGYPHEVLQAYDGDVLTTIDRNAQAGQGLSNFCDEMDAWHRQGNTMPGAVVLAGDECFGWADRRLISTDDVLISVCLRKFDFVGSVASYLDPAIRNQMAEGLAADVDEIVSRSGRTQLHDLKDFLYLDHRIQWGLLPWRRFVIGEYFEVREPFLQTEMLEVIKSLPASDRVGKALYREAIQELVPEVFSIPRAQSGQAAPMWRQEILRAHARIKELLKTPSGLDAVIEPAAIGSLLDSLSSMPQARPSWKVAVRNMVGPAAARALRSFVRPETPRSQSPETILIRLLVLREFLKG